MRLHTEIRDQFPIPTFLFAATLLLIIAALASGCGSLGDGSGVDNAQRNSSANNGGNNGSNNGGVHPYPVPITCWSDADCESSEICVLAEVACACAPCPPNAVCEPCDCDDVEPVGQCAPASCDDGSEILCDMVPEPCPAGLVSAARNGCFACLDPFTCLPPTTTPPPPPVECYSDFDCDDGESCVFHDVACECPECPPDADCEPCACPMVEAGTCLPDAPIDLPTPCESDEDCGDGSVCELNAYDCDCGPCPEDIECPPCACPEAEYGYCVELPVLPPPPPHGACGGFAGFACDDDQFCDFADDVPACGAADHLGECQPRPDACYEIYAPVCGCDGVTYDNDCFAHGAGTDVAYVGHCEDEPKPLPVPDPEPAPEPGTSCGGWSGDTCGDDEFCDFGRDYCDWADASGTCRPRPTACTLEYAPVCGCDGQTYPSECAAWSAGVDAAYDGECDER